jgi:Ca2+/Na+ antiporter
MVTVNLLSTLLAWIARSYELTPLPALAVTVFAIGNSLIGIFLMLRLMRDHDAGQHGS